MDGISSQKSYTAEEFQAGIANGTIDVEKLRQRANVACERLLLEDKPDVYVRRAPIEPLNVEEKQVLADAIKRLKAMVKVK